VFHRSLLIFVSDDYLFKEILELVDLDLRASGDGGGCNQFHFMPRFVRDLPGKIISWLFFLGPFELAKHC